LDRVLRAKGLEGAAGYRIHLLGVAEGMRSAVGLALRVHNDTGRTVLTPWEDETLCKGVDLVERMAYVVAAHALDAIVPVETDQLQLPAES
jgi:hypothetical protein